MTDLFIQASGETIIPARRYDQTRVIRSIIAQLRRDGLPVGSSAGRDGGYFLAETDEQLEPSIQRFHTRAMSSLKQEAALKRTTFDQLFDQYKLELEQENANDSQTH